MKRMRIRKPLILSMVLCLFLVFVMTGCKKTLPEEVKPEPVPTGAPEQSEEVKAEPQKDTIDSLEDVASINGVSVDELNYSTDDEGNLTFLGAKFSEKTATSVDEVVPIFTEIRGLVGADPSKDYVYSGSQTDPVSGNTFYIFSKAESIKIDGQELFGPNSTSMIKLFFDRDGVATAISSNEHENNEFYANAVPISKDDVYSYFDENMESLYPGGEVVKDATTLYFWKSEGFSLYFGGNIIPVYGVFIDRKDDDKDKPYTLAIIPAIESPNMAGAGVKVLPYSFFKVENLEYFENIDTGNAPEYTSLKYFDDYEDAGEYTYTIDATTLREYSSPVTPYVGPDSYEVTVSVMKRKGTDIFVLGDFNKRLVTCNYSETKIENSPVNVLISEDPSDMSKWHFEYGNDPFTGAEYFCDPNYVIGTYATMLQVYDAYDDLYGYKGADFTGRPTYLCVYNYSTPTYPDDPSGFTVNANSGGEINDWNVYNTSPSASLCLDRILMGHEMGHAIHSAISPLAYYNETGGVIETYGDLLGFLSTKASQGVDKDKDWFVGGEYTAPMRMMSDPGQFNQPYYKNGVNYIQSEPLPMAKIGIADMGGAHENNSVLCYVAYKMNNPDEGNVYLSLKEILDLWLEALYYLTPSTDFDDMGHILTFLSERGSLPSEKKELVEKCLEDYGIVGNSDVFKSKLEAEEYDTIHIVLDESELSEPLLEVGARMIESDRQIVLGGTTNHELTVRVKKGLVGDLFFELAYCDGVNAQNMGFAQITAGNEEPLSEVKVVCKEVYINSGEEYNYDGNEPMLVGSPYGVLGYAKDVSLDEPGIYYVSAVSPDAAPGEYILYLITVE